MRSAQRFSAPWLLVLRLCFYGGLAQLARAPALQAGGQRFESVILHKFKVKGKSEKLRICYCLILDSDL